MEPITISNAAKTGGWFWYKGWVRGGKVNDFLFKGTIRVALGDEETGESPLIECLGLLFPPDAFLGEIWGPVVPPWKQQ